MFDILIKNGTVYDGTGSNPLKKNIGIIKNKIYLLRKEEPSSRKIIDAGSLVISPGFIDIHSHTDEVYFLNPRAESKIRQGITTEVVGNCGVSPYPIYGNYYGIFKRRFFLEYGKNLVSWRSPEEFYEKLNKRGLGINAAFLVGHGNLRHITGAIKPGKIRAADFKKMKEILTESLECGSWGMSTGLAYNPSGFANIEELVELSKVLKRYDAIYTTHLRSEEDNLIAAVEEAIEIARHSGVGVQISHHKASGKRNWGKVKKTLKLIKKAQDKGSFIHCDQYPYTASATSLDMILPGWVKNRKRTDILKILKDSKNYKKIAAQISREPLHIPGWHSILISEVLKKTHKKFEGKCIVDAAEILGKSPPETTLDLIIENEFEVSAIFFTMCEEDVESVLKAPFTCIGTDATARATYGILSKGNPHPRSYGAFPRVLSEYVRGKKILDLKEAIRKMTYLPASIMGFKDRGKISSGYKADIVIFDDKKIKDMATYENPHQYATGIEYLIINGKLVLDKGKHTGTLAGQILYH